MSEENIEQNKEMSLIEKVKLMNDLATASQNSEIIEAIKKHPNGEKIYKIFVDAIEKELASTMTGKQETVKEINNLSSVIKQAQQTMNNFRDLNIVFMKSPLVEVLNLINRNLGGQKFQISDMNSSTQLQHRNHQSAESIEYDSSGVSMRSTGLSSL